MSNEKKLSERFAEALRNSDMVRMDAKTNTAIISLRIGPGEMDEVLAVLRAAESKEDAVLAEREACARIAEESREEWKHLIHNCPASVVDKGRWANECSEPGLSD
jgi:hypothetical protein